MKITKGVLLNTIAGYLSSLRNEFYVNKKTETFLEEVSDALEKDELEIEGYKKVKEFVPCPQITHEERAERLKKLVEHGRECWKDYEDEDDDKMAMFTSREFMFLKQLIMHESEKFCGHDKENARLFNEWRCILGKIERLHTRKVIALNVKEHEFLEKYLRRIDETDVIYFESDYEIKNFKPMLQKILNKLDQQAVVE